MMTFPNTLSFCRIPLAFVFLQDNPTWRFIAILLALITDGLDGYFARRHQITSKFGTMLDPITDKFFVFFSLAILMGEHKLQLWKVAAMLCRDFSIIIFGTYLAITGHLTRYRFRAIWCGKVTTVLQLIVLMGLTLQIVIPSAVFILFIFFGILALGELYWNLSYEKNQIGEINLL